MNYLVLIPALIFGNFFEAPGQHTAVELGKGFYYSGDSSDQQILFMPSYMKPVVYFSQSPGNIPDTSIRTPIPKVSWVAIPDVTGFGFNSKYVLAVSNNKTQSRYWLIDKRREPGGHGLTQDEERMILSNVRMIDFKKFLSLQKRFGITVHDIEFYGRNLQKN